MHLNCYTGPPNAKLVINSRDISQTSSTTASVVLHWEVKGENISGIVITSSPALPCGSQCEVVGEGGSALEQTVEFGVEYNITVRADNCGGRQNGSESDTVKLLLNGGCGVLPASLLTFIIQFCAYSTVPGEISGFSLDPVYSNTSGSLTELAVMWDMVEVSYLC